MGKMFAVPDAPFGAGHGAEATVDGCGDGVLEIDVEVCQLLHQPGDRRGEVGVSEAHGRGTEDYVPGYWGIGIDANPFGSFGIFGGAVADTDLFAVGIFYLLYQMFDHVLSGEGAPKR